MELGDWEGEFNVVGAMNDSAGQVAVPTNPLSNDLVLFNMYMTAVDAVLADAEISGTLAELEFSPNTLRMAMCATAGEVLRGASKEFAAYAVARERIAQEPDSARSPADVQLSSAGADTSASLTWLGRWLAAIGLAAAVAGVASIIAWPWTQWLVWAGAALFIPAALTYGYGWISGQERFKTLQGTPSPGHPVLARARGNLMAAIPHNELVAHARTLIGSWREARFSHLYSVTSISGLSETYDSTFQVATNTAADLEGLLSRVNGASIGVAGPRGVGKSTLIRSYCDDASQAADGDLRCMVSAPVDYNSQEFVLHLFAVFCRAVIRRYDMVRAFSLAGGVQALLRAARRRMWRLLGAAVEIALVASLLHWQKPVAVVAGVPPAWVFDAAIALAGLGLARVVWATARLSRKQTAEGADSGPRLAAAARQHLTRVRYLQTYTSGWSGTLGLPRGGSGQFSRSLARAEQKPTYPEVVGDFQEFAREVAACIHLDGGQIFIGIDELDKIGTPDQAEKFLNAIKGIFGIPHVYFMVSVSDEALASFERRGLPLRDTFDSSFDEIIHVGTLSYTESRRLLNRRVTGLTEPYVALCYCLGGGLARDIIRAARQVVRAGETIAGTSRPDAADEVDSTAAFVLLQNAPDAQQPTLSAVCGALVREELRRKSHAVAQAASSVADGQSEALQDCLQNVVRSIAREEQALKMVDMASRGAAGELPSVSALRTDFAAYAYYCATLQEVFTDHRDAGQIIRATSPGAGPGAFDALAAARHAFALDTQLAWQAISQFREAWGLKTLAWAAPSSALPAPSIVDRASGARLAQDPLPG
jgi:KAP family P-loop domain